MDMPPSKKPKTASVLVEQSGPASNKVLIDQVTDVEANFDEVILIYSSLEKATQLPYSWKFSRHLYFKNFVVQTKFMKFKTLKYFKSITLILFIAKIRENCILELANQSIFVKYRPLENNQLCSIKSCVYKLYLGRELSSSPPVSVDVGLVRKRTLVYST